MKHKMAKFVRSREALTNTRLALINITLKCVVALALYHP